MIKKLGAVLSTAMLLQAPLAQAQTDSRPPASAQVPREKPADPRQRGLPEIAPPTPPLAPPGTAPKAVEVPASNPALPVTAGKPQQEVAGRLQEPVRATIDSLSESDIRDVLSLLKTHFLDPSAFSELETSRATLQGVLARIAPGAAIISAPVAAGEEQSHFRAEILDDHIGYLRLGALGKNNIGEMDAALPNFVNKGVQSVVLDLRATAPSSDFDLAAEVIKRFCPKGKMLFTIKKPGAKQERILTSNEDPKFTGLSVVLTDGDTAGAAEVIAAVLRIQARSLLVGAKTSGQAVEFAELPLRDGKVLKVAVAEIILPETAPIFPEGVKPDLTVEMSREATDEILRLSLESGISQFVYEKERPRMNEASLVAGTNPEFDAAQAAQLTKGDKPRPPLRDLVLQRAVDSITTIGIYQSKPGVTLKGK